MESLFNFEWSLSGVFGLLALIGLLWLGNRHAIGNRKKGSQLLFQLRCKAQAAKHWLSANGSWCSQNEVPLRDSEALEELRLRIEEQPEGLVVHGNLRQRSEGVPFPAELD